jgi:hypothetical protein
VVRRLLTVLAGVAVLTTTPVLGGCSSGGGSSATTTTTAAPRPLAVGDIPAAVAALEARLGGPQQYTEINAIPDGVNLFVSTSPTTEQAWFFHGGQLDAPSGDDPASRPTFAAGAYPLDRGQQLVADLQQRFPGSAVVSFALLVVDGAPAWAVRSQSAKGGNLIVLYQPDGTLRSVAPAS